MTTVLNALVPVFLLILLGVILRQKHFLAEATFNQLRKLVYWVSFPALLFSKISSASFDLSAIFIQVLFLVGAHLAVLVIALVFAAGTRMPRKIGPTFVQGAFRGNLAFVGMPIITYGLVGVNGKLAIVEPQMYLILSAMIPFFNILGVLIFSIGASDLGDHPVRKTAGSIATNPLIGACALGLLFSLLHIPLPSPLSMSFRLLGSISLPLALVTIGASLRFHGLRDMFSYALGASLIKILLLPAVGYLAVLLLPIGQRIDPALFILLACPGAISSYILADQMDGDAPLAGNIIVLSTALSFLPISLILLLIQHATGA